MKGDYKMQKLKVMNRRNNEKGVATPLENGRFEIVEGGNTKEVAQSTFKRWYKVLGEVQEQPEKQLSVTVEAEEVPVAEAPFSHKDKIGKASLYTSPARKCTKIVTKIPFGKVFIVITEYDGYVCDVVAKDIYTEEEIYKSSKMSIKDTLKHLGYYGERLSKARKKIMALKKEAKQSLQQSLENK